MTFFLCKSYIIKRIVNKLSCKFLAQNTFLDLYWRDVILIISPRYATLAEREIWLLSGLQSGFCANPIWPIIPPCFLPYSAQTKEQTNVTLRTHLWAATLQSLDIGISDDAILKWRYSWLVMTTMKIFMITLVMTTKMRMFSIEAPLGCCFHPLPFVDWDPLFCQLDSNIQSRAA